MMWSSTRCVDDDERNHQNPADAEAGHVD